MPSYYDAYGRPLRVQIPGNRQRIQPRSQAGAGSGPTLDDYQRLAGSHSQLEASNSRMAQRIHEQERQIGETDQRLQQLETELAETKAALFHCKERRAEQEEETWKDRFIKLQAEMENLRKRTEQRYADQAAKKQDAILLDMLPLADHLEMALAHGEKLTDPAAVDFLGNIQATHQAFLSTLKRYGVEPILAEGQPFDPNQHEAVGHIPSPDVPADHVAHVLQTGYVNGERLLRPTRVMVSQ